MLFDASEVWFLALLSDLVLLLPLALLTDFMLLLPLALLSDLVLLLPLALLSDLVLLLPLMLSSLSLRLLDPLRLFLEATEDPRWFFFNASKSSSSSCKLRLLILGQWHWLCTTSCTQANILLSQGLLRSINEEIVRLTDFSIKRRRMNHVNQFRRPP